MKYGKYVFNDKQQAEEKIADLSSTNEAGEVTGHPHDIVKIGHELITEAYSVEPNGTKHRFVGVDFNSNKF